VSDNVPPTTRLTVLDSANPPLKTKDLSACCRSCPPAGLVNEAQHCSQVPSPSHGIEESVSSRMLTAYGGRTPRAYLASQDLV
jgi:hypothetical protein